ncbi:hypothetical protein BCR37DRAFT_406280 [Protomyces lactucae-debilis]|uniref:Uncharacterized protein n=1 Tax=Protomyces lactucae-debilis TaxID=2754530 RepID=A0A1Y2EY61_PROLT|nr:uncharacterized protein BCR37DRAFT_406280 [Protomyces lactucae-debilis]ORY76036.1 hypothetical protein BCR37DRAFT_406280 [Protomyces lactucae-debilis]
MCSTGVNELLLALTELLLALTESQLALLSEYELRLSERLNEREQRLSEREQDLIENITAQQAELVARRSELDSVFQSILRARVAASSDHESIAASRCSSGQYEAVLHALDVASRIFCHVLTEQELALLQQALMNWEPPVFATENMKTDYMINYLNANGWAAPGLAFISMRSHRLRVAVQNAEPPLVLTCASDIGLVPFLSAAHLSA